MKFLTVASCLAVGLSPQFMTAAYAESPPASVSAPQPPAPRPAIQKRAKAAALKKEHGSHKDPHAPHNGAGPLAAGGAIPPGPPPGASLPPGGPPPGPPPGQGLPLFPKTYGPLTPVGDYLKEKGVNLGILVDNFYLHTINTGLVPNKSMNAGDIKYHADFDLDQILGIPHTKLNFDETEYWGSLNAFNFVFYSNSYFFPGAGGYTTTMLSRLTLETKLMDDRLDIEVGRMNPIFSFMTPLYCGACFNGTQARNAFFPGPDAQVWGGRAAYKLTPQDTVQVGLYENDLYVFQHTNGWYFSTNNAIGYIAAANWVHETTFAEDTHPLKFEFGAFHNSAVYSDPYYNTDFSSHVMNPTARSLLHSEGVTGVFGQVRKVIWSEDNALGNPFAQNVAIYGSLFVTPEAGISYPLEAITGVEWSNFVPGQPFWMVGAGLHYAFVGDEKAMYEQYTRILLGGPNVRTQQHMFDPTVVLRFPFTPFMIVQPYAFYFINQDQSYLPAARVQKDGFFVGARITFNLGAVLGLGAGAPPI